MGSDFGLVPSLFEPSGIVQQEYFVAGTPVVAFKTGGLKDTVFEFMQTEGDSLPICYCAAHVIKVPVMDSLLKRIPSETLCTP